ncbi:hypothetical protein CORC01_02623 [Colletotrichum orchidophilum]|uniref:Uncharacterized protein n=1 Tax=Colletotrichum orchidophilum TaxID=1209926 RepID=A0A1G4BKV8_9PEZI|nr:uncharacterized protein CORC01_02623 [Colletotrichum orchidophilum]OHF02044.1 hypothetical protein CORC01_02623 [Colletotrichum orchidophilum]
MRFLSTIVLATLTASGVVTALPHDLAAVSGDGVGAVSLEIETTIENREARGPNTPADVKKHDDNHLKKANNNCGKGCEQSLASYHSQASKDSKNSKASKASKNQKGGRSLENTNEIEEMEVEQGVQA